MSGSMNDFYKKARSFGQVTVDTITKTHTDDHEAMKLIIQTGIEMIVACLEVTKDSSGTSEMYKVLDSIVHDLNERCEMYLKESND